MTSSHFSVTLKRTTSFSAELGNSSSFSQNWKEMSLHWCLFVGNFFDVETPIPQVLQGQSLELITLKNLFMNCTSYRYCSLSLIKHPKATNNPLTVISSFCFSFHKNRNGCFAQTICSSSQCKLRQRVKQGSY